MDRKKLIPLFLSSAMLLLWACAEGDVVNATDDDELMKSKIAEASDEKFLESFITYCKKQKGCDAEIVKTSSSAKSSSSGKSSSSSAKSSSSGKSSSSFAKSSSSGKSSSSSAKSSSSGKSSSSSKGTPKISGKCDLIKPSVVHVGDDVIWRYLPDENSIESASFEWDVNNEVEKGIVEGELSGTGHPEIRVVFTKKGLKYGPTLTFGGQEFDCDNLTVVEAGANPESSSSSAQSSSSSKKESSSSSEPKSSSSATPEGHCAVSKSEVYVGEAVEWYIAGPDGEVLEAKYNWIDLGADGEVDSGDRKSDFGAAKVSVIYTSTGSKETLVQFAQQGLISCDKDENGDPLLNVISKAESSSSAEEPEESSSSEEPDPESSSSKQKTSSSSFDPGVIEF